MVYTVPWTEGAPVGAATPADTIDTELQNLKISIRERLEDLIDDWTVDGTDPKVFNVAAVLAAVIDSNTIENNNSWGIYAWNWDTESVTPPNPWVDPADFQFGNDPILETYHRMIMPTN